MPSPATRIAALSVLALGLAAACHETTPPASPACERPVAPDEVAVPAVGVPPTAHAATAAEADAFVAAVNADLLLLLDEADRASWVKATYITPDTEKLEAKSQERVMEYLARKIKEARRFEGLALSADTSRSLYLLKFSAGLPAPNDAKKRTELSEIASQMEGIYGRGKFCSPKLKGHGKDKKQDCFELDELSELLGESRDPAVLLETWKGWHSIAPEIRPLYARYVELGNEGARDLGFSDMGEIWKGRYDMSGDDFLKEMDRLWEEVRPLYEQLHCFVRMKLRKQYGEAVVGKGKAPIPAHLLGNMWAQEWERLYARFEPYPGKGQPDLTAAMKAKKWQPIQMVKTAEGFFTSLGMAPLPQSFFDRSLFEKPRDRSVVCHASAWDVGKTGDLRIKMCIQVNADDLVTLHHELGHDYYYQQYHSLTPLFQEGANDGFHEGIGDTLALSVTPPYLQKIGLIGAVKPSHEADINLLLQRALDGVAFLPFGKLIDQWRFDVFSGKTKADQYNAAWWALRKKYQGIAPGVERSEADFDPGAKYHIPANVPYTRYFIARIIQYQFHRALCRAAGQTGPLHTCSIYGNAAAGQKLMAMLRLGASKPWPEALAALSGETRMDATAILDYYAPLSEWLHEQTKGEQCGWE